MTPLSCYNPNSFTADRKGGFFMGKMYFRLDLRDLGKVEEKAGNKRGV